MYHSFRGEYLNYAWAQSLKSHQYQLTIIHESRLLSSTTVVIKSGFLTLMLLTAKLANTKLCKNAKKTLKHLANGTHLRVLSKNFPMSTNMTGF